MSADANFTKENLDMCLRELAKEFRKINGTKMSAEIILVGGAAILANYGFREMTYDMDAVVMASSAMKEAINRVGDRLNLPNGWLNTDFTRTTSYSDKLFQVSSYYRTYSNILTVRTVTAEYLVAMKLMSGRKYKNDLSDIAGILLEHQRLGMPLTKESIESAFAMLYGDLSKMHADSKSYLEGALNCGDYENLYRQSRQSELQSKEILLDFNDKYPKALKEESIDAVLERARQRRDS